MDWSGDRFLGGTTSGDASRGDDGAVSDGSAAAGQHEESRLGVGASITSAAVAMLILLTLLLPEPQTWAFEYFPNDELKGEPIRSLRDRPDFPDIRNGLPSGLPDREAFSVRMRSCVSIAKAGVYRFSLKADDGARLFVDGGLLVDAWQKGASKEVGRELSLAEGEHAVVIEYANRVGPASLTVNMSDAAYRSVRSMRGRTSRAGVDGECKPNNTSSPTVDENAEGVEEPEPGTTPERDEELAP